MKIVPTLLCLFLGKAMSRLAAPQPQTNSTEQRDLITASIDYLGGCIRDLDCGSGLTCNLNVNMCDNKAAYARYALCSADWQCDEGIVDRNDYCNTNINNADVKSAGLGKCNRYANEKLYSFCTDDSDCTTEFQVCGSRGICAKIGRQSCKEHRTCASYNCDMDKNECQFDSSRSACWEKNKWSGSSRSGDCIPMRNFFGHKYERNYRHTFASNEFLRDTKGCNPRWTMDAKFGGEDLAVTYTWDLSTPSVNVRVQNEDREDKFCFDDDEFTVGCKVDRYIC